jgi:hypothetical protein
VHCFKGKGRWLASTNMPLFAMLLMVANYAGIVKCAPDKVFAMLTNPAFRRKYDGMTKDVRTVAEVCCFLLSTSLFRPRIAQAKSCCRRLTS